VKFTVFDFGFVLAGGDQQAGGGRILHSSISPTRCKLNVLNLYYTVGRRNSSNTEKRRSVRIEHIIVYNKIAIRKDCKDDGTGCV
jgi:hypothetical protein